jgi:hypothetical protein
MISESWFAIDSDDSPLRNRKITTVMLGCVDGFNQYQRACKADDGRVADVGLLAAHGDAFEAFELADRLFDAGA